MESETQQPVYGALDFAQQGFDVVITLAEETTLEVTDLAYGALRAAGVWNVVLTPVEVAQKGVTKVIFRCMRFGGRVVTSAAGLGARLAH